VKLTAAPVLLQNRTLPALPDRSGGLFFAFMNAMLFAGLKVEQNHG
jgi:hypothetical protein